MTSRRLAWSAAGRRFGLRLLFLLIGSAVASSLGLLGWFVIMSSSSSLSESWWGFAVLVGAILVVAAPLGLLGAVRRVEVVLAESLLDVSFPEHWEPHDRPDGLERFRAVAAFAGHVMLGVLTVLALTVTLPIGIGLSASSVFLEDGRHPLDVDWLPAVGSSSTWLNIVLGIVVVAASLASLLVLFPWGARLLALVFIGPSTSELAAMIDEQAIRAASRNRIARELHDSVGHSLSLISILATAVKGSPDDVEARDRYVDAIAEASRSALDNLDEGLRILREGGIETDRWRDTIADLDELLARFDQSGLEVRLTTTGDLDTVPEVIAREGHRIVAESLTNALRHGSAPVADLAIALDEEALAITVTNPARRASAGSRDRGGRGLVGVRERATILGGAMTAGHTGTEWRMVARLPLSSRRKAEAP